LPLAGPFAKVPGVVRLAQVKEAMMDLKIAVAGSSRRSALPQDEMDLGFGRYFTDHMFLWDYDPDRGWADPRIVPYGPLPLDPAAMVLHYAQQVFEGLKAYRGVDGGIRLFRYQQNLQRLLTSAERLCIPAFSVDDLADALKQLVLLDREWVPKTEGCSLYIRPTIIATDPFLGVRPSQRYLLYIILSPVAAYYPEGFNPIKIMASDKYVRAALGGVGEAKTGGNYAASLMAQMEAQRAGFTQVLWLDAKDHRYVEEVGTMNIFFVIGDKVITSPLTGTILPGVTRDSVLRLLDEWGISVEQRRLAIDEVIAAAQDGTLREVFGSGTAAVISPVAQIHHGETYQVADGKTGELSQRLYDHIFAIQYGKKVDPHGWVERIDV
jgi:branched-chain amino acid aminotransferase